MQKIIKRFKVTKYYSAIVNYTRSHEAKNILYNCLLYFSSLEKFPAAVINIEFVFNLAYNNYGHVTTDGH